MFTPLLVEKAPDMTLRVRCVQASKCAGERTTLALKPMGKVTRSPK